MCVVLQLSVSWLDWLHNGTNACESSPSSCIWNPGPLPLLRPRELTSTLDRPPLALSIVNFAPSHRLENSECYRIFNTLTMIQLFAKKTQFPYATSIHQCKPFCSKNFLILHFFPLNLNPDYTLTFMQEESIIHIRQLSQNHLYPDLTHKTSTVIYTLKPKLCV